MASSRSFITAFFMALTLSSMMSMSLAARHLLQSSLPNLPKPTGFPPLPSIPTLPQPNIPLPKPINTLPPLPTIPKVTLPPLPSSSSNSIFPNIPIPNIIPSIPFLSPPPSSPSP